MPEKAGAHCCSEHCRSGHCRHANTDRKKVTDKNQSPSFIFQTSVLLRIDCKQTSVPLKIDCRQKPIPLRIDCKQTSVLLRLLVVVQRASCGEVVDLALDVLKNCLVLFGTFLGDTVDNIGVLCDG